MTNVILISDKEHNDFVNLLAVECPSSIYSTGDVMDIYNPFTRRVNSFELGLKAGRVKSAISDFCDARGVNDTMRDTFMAYVRSLNASKFDVRKDGDTANLTVSKMTMEEVQDAWIQFVMDIRQILPHEKVS